MTAVLDINDLTIELRGNDSSVTIVDRATFSLGRGEVMGLIGESGSGKSMTGLALLGLIDAPGMSVTGSVRLDGQELLGSAERNWRSVRGKRISMIFQDPMTTLNPVLRIDTQIVETLQAHERVSRKAALARAREALIKVGISSPDERLQSYPHQFSGGMRQRVAIAIALLNRPSVLVADEATTALDVTIQAQVLAEVQALAAEAGTAMIWISHDLSVVSGLADKVSIMYAGRIVETGPTDSVLTDPSHPYTAGLIGSVPRRNQRGRALTQIPGMAPSLANLPQGCHFRPRCPRAAAICNTVPSVFEAGAGRTHRCHLPLEEVRS